ncbi:MAG: CDP-alcohol phosphatidyltransferase family protein [Victivallaceae bacterium]
MGLPNYLTFLRIFITPLFMIIYLKSYWFGISGIVQPYILLSLIILTELSDVFDGFFARKFSQVTDLGKILDPVVDSVYRISVFITFTQPPVNLPILLIFIFLARDSVTSTLRTVCALRGFVLAARTTGKLKAILQGTISVLIILAMIPYSLGKFSSETLMKISTIGVSLVAVYSVFSGIEYLWANKSYLFLLLKEPRNSGKGSR